RAFGDGAESGIKGGTRNRSDPVTEKLNGGSFAECTRFALEGNARGLAIGCAHRQALSCNKERKTKSKDSLRDGKKIRRNGSGAAGRHSPVHGPRHAPEFLSAVYFHLQERGPTMNRPEAGEFADYYANYIAKVPGSDGLSVLESQRLQMLQLFAGRSERDGSFRYAPGKWTVKEVLGHITD